MSTINQNINKPAPVRFDDLMDNLKAVVLCPELTIQSDLSIISLEKTSPSQNSLSFQDLANNVEEVFWRFLGNQKLGTEALEYVPARLFTRLERIATKKYNLSLINAQQILSSFEGRVLKQLKEDLPMARIRKSDTPVSEIEAPFYHEIQAKLGSCQIHALNNCYGRSVLNLAVCEEKAHEDTDDSGIALSLIQNIDSHNFICQSFETLEKCLENPHFDRFFTAKYYSAFTNGASLPHAIAYRKDAQGQWWKIDSLFKINDASYQVPVDLATEKKTWIDTLTGFLVSQEEFAQLVKKEVKQNFAKLALLQQSLEQELSIIEAHLSQDQINRKSDEELVKSLSKVLVHPVYTMSSNNILMSFEKHCIENEETRQQLATLKSKCVAVRQKFLSAKSAQELQDKIAKSKEYLSSLTSLLNSSNVIT